MTVSKISKALKKPNFKAAFEFMTKKRQEAGTISEAGPVCEMDEDLNDHEINLNRYDDDANPANPTGGGATAAPAQQPAATPAAAEPEPALTAEQVNKEAQDFYNSVVGGYALSAEELQQKATELNLLVDKMTVQNISNSSMSNSYRGASAIIDRAIVLDNALPESASFALDAQIDAERVLEKLIALRHPVQNAVPEQKLSETLNRQYDVFARNYQIERNAGIPYPHARQIDEFLAVKREYSQFLTEANQPNRQERRREDGYVREHREVAGRFRQAEQAFRATKMIQIDYDRLKQPEIEGAENLYNSFMTAFITPTGQTPKDTQISGKLKRSLEWLARLNRINPRGDEARYYPSMRNPRPPAYELTAQQRMLLAEITQQTGGHTRELTQQLNDVKAERPKGFKFMAKLKAGYGEYQAQKEPLKQAIGNLQILQEDNTRLQQGVAPTALTPSGVQAALAEIMDHATKLEPYVIPSLQEKVKGLEEVSENASGRAFALADLLILRDEMKRAPHDEYLTPALLEAYRKKLFAAEAGQKKVSLKSMMKLDDRFEIKRMLEDPTVALIFPTAASVVNAKVNHRLAKDSRARGGRECERLAEYLQHNQPDFLINRDTVTAYAATLENAEAAQKMMQIGATGKDAQIFIKNQNTNKLPTFDGLIQIRNQIIADQEARQRREEEANQKRAEQARANQEANQRFLEQARANRQANQIRAEQQALARQQANQIRAEQARANQQANPPQANQGGAIIGGLLAGAVGLAAGVAAQQRQQQAYATGQYNAAALQQQQYQRQQAAVAAQQNAAAQQQFQQRQQYMNQMFNQANRSNAQLNANLQGQMQFSPFNPNAPF